MSQKESFNCLLIAAILISSFGRNYCSECDLAKIFRTPRDFDHLEIVERGGFDRIESTTPSSESLSNGSPKKSENNFANAHVSVKFGSDYTHGSHLMPKIPLECRNYIGNLVDSLPVHHPYYPPSHILPPLPPPYHPQQFYHPYPPPVPYIFPNYYYWNSHAPPHLPPQLNDYFRRHPDYFLKEEVFIERRPLRRVEKNLLPVPVVDVKNEDSTRINLFENAPPQDIETRLEIPQDQNIVMGEEKSPEKREIKRDVSNVEKEFNDEERKIISMSFHKLIQQTPEMYNTKESYVEMNQNGKNYFTQTSFARNNNIVQEIYSKYNPENNYSQEKFKLKKDMNDVSFMEWEIDDDKRTPRLRNDDWKRASYDSDDSNHHRHTDLEPRLITRLSPTDQYLIKLKDSMAIPTFILSAIPPSKPESDSLDFMHTPSSSEYFTAPTKMNLSVKIDEPVTKTIEPTDTKCSSDSYQNKERLVFPEETTKQPDSVGLSSLESSLEEFIKNYQLDSADSKKTDITISRENTDHSSDLPSPKKTIFIQEVFSISNISDDIISQRLPRSTNKCTKCGYEHSMGQYCDKCGHSLNPSTTPSSSDNEYVIIAVNKSPGPTEFEHPDGKPCDSCGLPLNPSMKLSAVESARIRRSTQCSNCGFQHSNGEYCENCGYPLNQQDRDSTHSQKSDTSGQPRLPRSAQCGNCGCGSPNCDRCGSPLNDSKNVDNLPSSKT